MNTTYKPFLNNKPKTDGTYSIMVRITTDKKHKYVTVGHSVKKQDWNSGTQNGRYVKASNVLHKVINNAIDSKLIELKTLASDITNADSVSIQKAAKGFKSESFLAFADRNLELLKAAKKIATYKKRKSVITELKSYLKDKDLVFKDFTVNFLEDYNSHLHSTTKNSINTINTKFRTLRALLYDAIKKDLMKQADNPFFKFTLEKEKTKKDRLTSTEIKTLEDLNLEEGTSLWHVRNYFMFSFLNFGMRFGDFALVNWSNIQIDGTDKRLVYQMGKTGEIKNILLTAKALKIIEWYERNRKGNSIYIFPLLSADFEKLPEEKQFNQISSKNAVVNKQLKSLAAKAGIKTNLSFHIARHSFASVARDLFPSLSHLQKALGHSSLSITETYLNTLADKSLDEFSAKVYNN